MRIVVLCSGSLGTTLLISHRRRGWPGGGADLNSSAAMKKQVHTILRINRISGLFWFCLGVATLWYSDIRHSWFRPGSWILPSVGLFWAVVGGGEILSTFRRGRQAAIAQQVAMMASKSAASNANARGRARLICVLFLCSGIAMVYFSGIRVGTSPAVVSQPREEDGRLAEIVTQHAERAFEQNGHIGLVVGAIAKGEETLLGFGTRRVGDSRPPDADTVFEIGSISKVFTGILWPNGLRAGSRNSTIASRTCCRKGGRCRSRRVRSRCSIARPIRRDSPACPRTCRASPAYSASCSAATHIETTAKRNSATRRRRSNCNSRRGPSTTTRTSPSASWGSCSPRKMDRITRRS